MEFVDLIFKALEPFIFILSSHENYLKLTVAECIEHIKACCKAFLGMHVICLLLPTNLRFRKCLQYFLPEKASRYVAHCVDVLVHLFKILH